MTGLTLGALRPTDPTVIPRDAVCQRCQGRGCLRLSTFIVEGQRALNWHCQSCGYAWVEPERRQRRE